MATQSSGTLVTYEDYCNLPDDERYEVIDGELLMAAASSVLHQMVQDNIGLPLSTFIKANNLGRVFYSATDVLLSDTNVVQPDILFVSRGPIAYIDLQCHQWSARPSNRDTVAIHCAARQDAEA